MAFLLVLSSPSTAFSCGYFLEDVSYLWEEGGGLTKNILSYLENVTFDLGREGLKANFGNVMIYAGIFHGNRPLSLFNTMEDMKILQILCRLQISLQTICRLIKSQGLQADADVIITSQASPNSFLYYLSYSAQSVSIAKNLTQ